MPAMNMGPPKRIDFLRYNGDLVIMTALLGIAGAILTGITIGLFQSLVFILNDFILTISAYSDFPPCPLLPLMSHKQIPNWSIRFLRSLQNYSAHWC